MPLSDSLQEMEATQQYDDEEDVQERLMLAQAEAEAARQHAARTGQFATPVEEYGHMPVPT